MIDPVTNLSFTQIQRLQAEWLEPSLTEEVVEEIRGYGRAKMPQEACGIVLPTGLVVEFANHAAEPEHNYVIQLSEISEFVNNWLTVAEVPAGVVQVGFIVWHTHPSGFVGPSQTDIQLQKNLKERQIDIPQVVVAMPDGPAVRF